MKKVEPKRTEPLKAEYGIRELIWADPRTLDSNPMNWRRHNHRQRQAIQATLDANGWAGALLYNEVTGRLIDGHCRKEEAIRRGEKSVPVLIGRWTEEQEKHLLATLDPIAAMAETQASALVSLTEAVSASLEKLYSRNRKAAEALKNLNADLDTMARDVREGLTPSVMLASSRDRKSYDRYRFVKKEIEEEHSGNIVHAELVDEVIFPSSNMFGIPDLRKDRLCNRPPTDVWDKTADTITPHTLFCYSAGPRNIPSPEKRKGGFLSFFCEDFRFEKCWSDTPEFTEWLVPQKFTGVCVPDFSTWTDWPLAVRLHQLYKSRWVARYWQEAGVDIIPIVQSIGLTEWDSADHMEEALTTELCLHSIPQPCPVLATEARNSSGAADYWTSWINLHKLALDIVKPDYLVIYGGRESAKNFLARLPRRKKTEIILLGSFTSRRRKGDPVPGKD